MSLPTGRREELLADRAIQGLSEAEARELFQLGGAGDDSFDLAAAAAALAELERNGDGDALPQAVAEQVMERAKARRDAAVAARHGGLRRVDEGPRRGGRSLGWLAVAAALVAALFGLPGSC